MWWLVVALVGAQGSLADAAERARGAWLAHDPQGLVGQGGSVVLQIPGADPLVPLDRAQASELLRRHWRNAVERSLTLRGVHDLGAGEGDADLGRRDVGVGAAGERREKLPAG